MKVRKKLNERICIQDEIKHTHGVDTIKASPVACKTYYPHSTCIVGAKLSDTKSFKHNHTVVFKQHIWQKNMQKLTIGSFINK